MIKLGKFEICPLGRSLEFVEDAQGKFSTPSLIALTGVAVLSVVIILDAFHSKTDPTVIGVFATLIASLYGIKKGFDSSEAKAQIKADAGPDSNVTTINQPDKVNVAGDAVTKPNKGKK